MAQRSHQRCRGRHFVTRPATALWCNSESVHLREQACAEQPLLRSRSQPRHAAESRPSVTQTLGRTQGLSAAGRSDPRSECSGPTVQVSRSESVGRLCRHRSLCVSTCYSSHASLKRNLPTLDTTPPKRAKSVPTPPPSNAIVDRSQRLRPSRAKVDDAYAVEERRRCPACMLRADSRVRGRRCPRDRAERASWHLALWTTKVLPSSPQKRSRAYSKDRAGALGCTVIRVDV